MVIEHTFVTTLPPQQAMASASEMLSQAGFVAENQGAFRLGETEWTSLLMKRGKKRAGRAKDPTECPQRVRMDWDRGRVTMAASIEPKAVRRYYGYGLIGMAVMASTSSRRGSSKDLQSHADLMVVIATSLEDVLARQSTPDIAQRSWMEMEAGLKLKAKKARQRSWIILGVFLAVVVGLIVFAVVASQH